MEIAINIFLGILGIYFLIGFLFGIFFLIKAPKIDSLMRDTNKKVRLLLFSGVIATWPFFISKLFKSKTV